MLKPDISIIVPIFNVAPYINRCLESVASQVYQGKLECLIIDDCGSDNSIEICEQFIQKYDGQIDFRVIHHEYNRGLAAARNTGIDAAKGGFVIHLDSDDWLETNAVETLVNKQIETGADIVSGNALMHKSEGNLLIFEPDYVDNIAMVHNTIELTMDHVLWRRLIRKELYLKNKIRVQEGVNIGEDHHTLPRLAYYSKKIAKVDVVVYHYNCMNPLSYMSQKVSSFNYRRFDSDLASIDILLEFFIGKDDYCIKRLSEIRQHFLKDYLYNAYKLFDRKAYYHVAKFIPNSIPFFLYWSYRKSKAVIRKFSKQ